MKLPNGEQAIIDERKVREYLLSPSHPVGRFKLKFFSGIGFGPDTGDRSSLPSRNSLSRARRGSPKKANSAESTRSPGS